MAKKASSGTVGTRSTASQTSSAKSKIEDDVEVAPTTRQRLSEHAIIVALTVKGILDEQITNKLA